MSLNVIIVNQFLKNLCSGTQFGGFQILLILELWGISFHAVVVFGLGKNLLFKFILGRCVHPKSHLNLEMNAKNKFGISILILQIYIKL